jgi:hypothetical protein
MLGRRYRKSVAEEDRRNTGRTWIEDGKRRQVGPIARRGASALSLRSGRSSLVSLRPEELGALVSNETVQ